MDETPRLPPAASDSLRPTRTAPLAPATQGSEDSGRAGPAFEVLLERLAARAAELEQKSKTLTSPAELPDALDTARASLEEALHLGAELLEAYRAARRTPEVHG